MVAGAVAELDESAAGRPMIHDVPTGFRLANVAGRAVLVAGAHYTDVAMHSSGALGSDPMEVLARPDLLSELSASLDESSVTGLLADVVLGPPVPRPQKSFGIGLNYQAHADEGGVAPPESPLVFTKFPSCIVGPTSDVRLRSDGCDYEGELVVVIGRGGKDIAPEDGMARGEFLADGDVITTTIEGIGTMSNRCVRVSDDWRVGV